MRNGGQRQKLSGDTYAALLSLDTNQLPGCIGTLLLFREPQELEVPDLDDDWGGRKDTFHNPERAATQVVSSGSRKCVAVIKDWLVIFVGKELSKVRACFFAHMSEDYKTINCTGDIVAGM